MPSSKLRRQIACDAARLMYDRDVGEYYVAKQKAARRRGQGWIKPSDLPTNAEIREQVQLLARLHEGTVDHDRRLREMRMRALWWMKRLAPFHPKIIGSVLTGCIREGSDIDLHVFAANPHAITVGLDDDRVAYTLQRKRIVKDGEQRVFTHIHIRDAFPIELTVYHPSLLGYRFRSSITNKAIPRAGVAELERLIALEHEMDSHRRREQLHAMDDLPDRINVFQSLLLPLEHVRQSPTYHPEGDALYHSQQVFMLAREQMPYDEEFLLAALLHDVGKSIEPDDHVAAGLEALEGFISPRTAWLIAHHMEAHKLHEGTIGRRRRRRLAEHPWFDDLCALGRCDRNGRVSGAKVDDLDEMLDYIEHIAELFAT